MAMIRQKRFEDQQKRMESFPRNRIPFYQSRTSASKDQMTFMAYRNHEISKASAMRQIADNNFLYEITEEQFDTEYKLLGYDYFIPDEIERLLHTE